MAGSEEEVKSLLLRAKKLRSWHLVPWYMANRWGRSGNSGRFYFLVLQNYCGWWLQPWNSKTLAPWQKSDKSRQCIKKQRHHFANKGLYSQSYNFSSSHVWMWEFYHEKGECWRIGVFVLWCWRRLMRVPWTARRSNYSILKETNPGYLLEGLILKLNSNTFATWCEELTHWKRPWCWERLRAGGEVGKEDEMVGWRHWLSGHKFEQTLGDSEGQWGLVCCSPWGRKVLYVT